MLKRGVISNIRGNLAEAFLPDEDNTVTAALPLANSINREALRVGNNCVIAFMDAEYINLADGVIIAIY